MPAIDDHDHVSDLSDSSHSAGSSGSSGSADDSPGPPEVSGPPGPPEPPDGTGLADLTDFAEFLRVSAELTGFDETELRATGMAREHHRTLLAHRARDEHALLRLWYVGAWPDEPPSSPRAYDRGLMWRTFRGAPPGSTAPGHGSWSEAPDGGDDR
ncbi:hypothetical protein [Kitasatospora sp. NBC_00458]|uniref:hypothetical protein n=1 Tax=Kitasatospora sp. NBC_00458 TaxID=2903568 RepID=UPI002E195766